MKTKKLNLYGIAPSTLLIMERRANLIETLRGFELLVLLEFEQNVQTATLKDKLTEHIRTVVVTVGSLGSRKDPAASQLHLDAIKRFVAVNQSGHNPALETYEASQSRTLTLCGKTLKNEVSRTWTELFVAPFPQSILCIGPHILTTTWLCAVLAEQMGKAQKTAKTPFDDAISDVKSYEPSRGPLHFLTTHRMVLGKPRFTLAE